jgi:hypothetical protein
MALLMVGTRHNKMQHCEMAVHVEHAVLARKNG